MRAAIGIAVLLLTAAPASFASEAAQPLRRSPQQQRLGLFASDRLCGGACSDSMVLEHTGGVIWGVGASGGAVVTATVDGHEAARGAADAQGRWRLTLPAMPPSTGHTVRLDSEGGSRTLSDVAFGAVILCSGQVPTPLPSTES